MPSRPGPGPLPGASAEDGTSTGEATSPAEPWAEVTFTPAAAVRAVIPARGETACPAASGTPAEPPVTNTASSPAGPITAIERAFLDSGRTWWSFFSSTVPASATSAATRWCRGVDTSVEGVAGSGWSNTPEAKIA